MVLGALPKSIYFSAHDGWSEIWEIVLLKSGDVERNPGPTYMTEGELSQISIEVVGEDSLHIAFDEVQPVSSKWLTFCCCLGLPASLLDTIAKDHPNNTGDCLFYGLKQWVRKNYDTEEHGPPTWRKLVEAVGNSSGGENPALASKIAEKHRKSDPLHVQATEENAAQPVMVSELHRAVGGRTDRTQRRSREMNRSSAFKSMYRSVISYMREVDIEEIKESLRYLTNPQYPKKLSVPRSVYKNATSTKELLAQLCPKYVNPEDTFVLKEIVKDYGSRQCKKVLKDYTDTYV